MKVTSSDNRHARGEKSITEGMEWYESSGSEVASLMV